MTFKKTYIVIGNYYRTADVYIEFLILPPRCSAGRAFIYYYYTRLAEGTPVYYYYYYLYLYRHRQGITNCINYHGVSTYTPPIVFNKPTFDVNCNLNILISYKLQRNVSTPVLMILVCSKCDRNYYYYYYYKLF